MNVGIIDKWLCLNMRVEVERNDYIYIWGMCIEKLICLYMGW